MEIDVVFRLAGIHTYFASTELMVKVSQELLKIYASPSSILSILEKNHLVVVVIY